MRPSEDGRQEESGGEKRERGELGEEQVERRSEEDEPIAVMSEARSRVEGVAWSGDGRRLVSGSDDGRVRVYEEGEGRGVGGWGLSHTIDLGTMVYGVAMGERGDRVSEEIEDREL